MSLRNLFPVTIGVAAAFAIAAPVAGASDGLPYDAPAAPSADVCNAASGPLSILGPYGPLGDYGPLGAKAGQANPAASCGGAASLALPGQTVGSFVTANLSLFR